MKRSFFYTLAFLLLSACSTTDDHVPELSRPDFETIPILDIEETFRISTFDEDGFFAFISGVAIGSDGTIFVGDRGMKKIFKFDPDGNYNGFLGGDGEGPGEFRHIGSMFILSSDTLVIDDTQLRRLTYFTEKNNNWIPVRTIARPYSDTEYGSEIFFIFSSLYPHPQGFLARFINSFTPVDTATYNFAYYKVYDHDLNPIDNREYHRHIVSNVVIRRVDGRSVSVIGIPEVHSTLYAITSDGRKISTWTGEPKVSISHITSGDSTGFYYHSNRIMIPEHEKLSLVQRFIPNPETAPMTAHQLKAYVPDYKGFARMLSVDDRDRIWILTQPFNDGDPEWLVYTMSGELLAAVSHPGGRLMHIQNNRLYFRFSSAEEEAALGVYEIAGEL